jgi:hypothetical protein
MTHSPFIPFVSSTQRKQKENYLHLYKGLTILPLSLSTCHCTSFVIIIFVLSLLAIETASPDATVGTAVRLELPVVVVS